MPYEHVHPSVFVPDARPSPRAFPFPAIESRRILRAVEHDTEPVTETRTVPEPDTNDPQSWLAEADVAVLDIVVLGVAGTGLLEVAVVVGAGALLAAVA
jgi:hypothetical protein